MPVESVTYISDFDSANPITLTDIVKDGAEHLRNIKLGVLNSMPNISGAMNASHTELNYLDGVTGTTGTGNLVLSASPTLTGTVTCVDVDASGDITGSIAADQIDSLTFADARIAESNVTQHEAAITITESQISDHGTYLPSDGSVVATTLSIGNLDTTLSRDAAGQLAVEGAAVITHNDGALTSGKVFFSNGVEPTTEGSNGDIFLVY